MSIPSEPGSPSWSLSAGAASYVVGFRDGHLLHLGFGLHDPATAWQSVEEPPIHYREDRLERYSEVYYEVGNEARWQGFELISAESTDVTLDIRLRDPRHGLEVELTYDVDETGLVVRRQGIRNAGQEPVILTACPSFRMHVPSGCDLLTSLFGTWSDEWRPQITRLPVGRTVLESRSGKTGYEHAPWFALDGADGTVFGSIAWSGNWRLEFHRDALGRTTITGGLNPWQLEHRIAPGATLVSPSAVLGWGRGDGNATSQVLHRYQRRIRPDPGRLPAVQFNTWYAGEQLTTTDRACALADIAAEVGCEVFVLDGEWVARLGDWSPDRARFPGGIQPLSEYVRGRGMDFGIWMEPEVVAPGARVLRGHPDWIHRRHGKPLFRQGRYVLDLNRPDVRQWVFDRVCSTVRSVSASWLKWDFNTDLCQGGDLDGGGDRTVGHVLGLYDLWDAVRREFPDLSLEGCAGGGGRLDLGSMARTHLSWMSDMVGPIQSLGIHFGSARAFAPGLCNRFLVHWPPDWPWLPDAPPGHGDLDFRARVAMLGAFGISAPLDGWDRRDLRRLAQHVQAYKSLRPLIFNGDVYRLTRDPDRRQPRGWAGLAFVSPDASRAGVFAFRLGGAKPDSWRVYVPGLDPDADYSVRRTDTDRRSAQSGRALGEGVVEIALPGNFRSALVIVDRI